MELVRLQRRGMVTIPSDIRHQLDMHEGQELAIRIVDKHHLSLEVMPSLTADELFARFPITEPIDDAAWHREIGDSMARERGIATDD